MRQAMGGLVETAARLSDPIRPFVPQLFAVVAGLVPATPIMRHRAFRSDDVTVPDDRGRRDKPGDDPR